MRRHNESMAWHDKLDMARRAGRFTVRGVAGTLGVGASSVSQWLSGVYEPSYAHLIALCRLFGVPPGWVLDDAAPDNRIVYAEPITPTQPVTGVLVSQENRRDATAPTPQTPGRGKRRRSG